MSAASVLVVTGAPGVGKSSVAAGLAERLAVCAHVEADVLHRMIRSGGQWPSAGTPGALAQLELRTHNAATLAASFARAGIPTVLDEVISLAAQVTALRDALQGCPVTLIGLTATPATIGQRDAGREKHTAALYTGVEERIRAVVHLNWIDTSALSLSQTVDEVQRAAGW